MSKPHAWYSALVIAIAGAMSAIAYPRAPERMPVHWNVSGEPDRFGSRLEGLWLLPAVMAAVWLLTRVLPKVDPRRSNFARMQTTYDFTINAILTAMLAFHGIAVAAVMGYNVPIQRAIPVVIGALLLALGNVLPRARPNWLFGVRTPWTLSSDRVWTRTHRVAGYLITGAGVVTLLAAALPGAWPFAATVTSIGVAVFGAVIYSYVLWEREGRS